MMSNIASHSPGTLPEDPVKSHQDSAPDASSHFTAKAAAHWTKEREEKVLAGKNLILKPSAAAPLLRAIGLLNADASMSSDQLKKFLQVNHMLALVAPELDDLAERHPIVRVFDACCGTSYLSFAVAWYLKNIKNKAAQVLGVDRNASVITTSQRRAAATGFEGFMHFAAADVGKAAWETFGAQAFGDTIKLDDGAVQRPHMVIALHACDTATDAALAAGVALKADVIAVAPCCHAELAQKWKTIGAHPLSPIFRTPNLRRETAAQVTDAMRLVLMRARGYEVTATEFVPAAHTPKNRLLLAKRRGNFLASAEAEFIAMKEAFGGQTIKLEDLLGPRS